jgi:hypothetical protein
MVLAARLTNLPPTRGARGSVHYVSWYPELTLWAIERVALSGSEFRSPLARQMPICRYLSNAVNAAVLLFENSWNLGLQFVKKSV